MKQVALVTGGSRGIGYGIAIQLAQAGFDLVINGVRPLSDVRESLKELENLGARVLYCQADVSSAGLRSQMVSEIRSYFGRLDILVNNAGVAPKERKDILEASEESFSGLFKRICRGLIS